MGLRAWAAVFCVVAPSVGVAGTYTLQPIAIPGASGVWAAGVNDSKTIIGLYTVPGQGEPAGFVGQLGQIATLPLQGSYPGSPQSGIASPSGINNEGTIAGTFLLGSNIEIFTFKGRQYAQHGVASGVLYGTFLPYVGTADHIAYDVYEAHGQTDPQAGTLASQALLDIGHFGVEVASINGHSQAAGQYLVQVGKYYRPAVFLTTATHTPLRLTPILPPHAQAAYGGWINDSAMIAGSYADAAGGLRGFVLANHVVTSFDMPTKAQTLITQGIDESGRVVGTYSDGVARYGFIYAGGAVSILGTFAATDTVHVGISPFARGIVVAHSNGAVAEAWLASCKPGSGC